MITVKMSYDIIYNNIINKLRTEVINMVTNRFLASNRVESNELLRLGPAVKSNLVRTSLNIILAKFFALAKNMIIK